jgi:Ca-activated chloride channel family protein
MDAQTGRKIWHKYLGDPTLAQPAVADGLVFASHPADDGRGYGFSAFRIESGALVWSRWLNNELLGAPVIEGDSIYVSTLSGTVVRFRRADGKRLWSKGLAATSAPWVSGGELYLSRRDGKKEVQAVVSAETGELLRSHREMDGSYVWDVPGDLGDWKAVWAFEGSRPAVLGGVRYEAMGGVIQASDPTTGDAFWTRRYAAAEKSRSIGTVAVAGSQVVVASRKGELYGLDIDTGYTLWAYSIGRPVVAQPVVAKGWVYATTTDGRVIGLQVGDTTLDGWHMWGGNPGHNGLTPPAAEKHASRD